MAVNDRIRALCQGALERARRHSEVSYVEVRWVKQSSERLHVRDGAPEGVGASSSRGFGVRVIAAGAWGFACAPREEEAALARAVAEAAASAGASARVATGTVRFPPAPARVGRYETPLEVDPFQVSLEDKLADLSGPEAELRRIGAPIRSAEAWMSWTK